MPIPTVSWINNNQALKEACTLWLTRPWVGIDTEFIRQNTFYPKPALIQIYDGRHINFIDPVSITEWEALAELLDAQSVLKIMHAPQEDMEVLKLLTGSVVSHLFDTQLAAGFCNLHYPGGYQSLVHTLLSINIAKEETCSNWLHRPLSNAQIKYASKDVYYLPALYRKLVKMMQDSHKNKLKWCIQEADLLSQQAAQEKDLQEAWKDIKLKRRLHPKQQKILKSLCTWRERYIRQQNIPRKRTFNNEQLLNISRQQPTRLYHLQRVPGLSPTLIRQYGKSIITVVIKAQQMEDAPHRNTNHNKLPVEKHIIMEKVQHACGQFCRSNTINPALFSGKKYARLIVQQWENTGELKCPEKVTAWKRALLQKTLDTLKTL